MELSSICFPTDLKWYRVLRCFKSVSSNEQQPGGMWTGIQEGCSSRTNAAVATVKWLRTLKGASIIFSLPVHSPAFRTARKGAENSRVNLNYSVVYVIVVISMDKDTMGRKYIVITFLFLFLLFSSRYFIFLMHVCIRQCCVLSKVACFYHTSF